jgi:ABC-type multidrug transport system ATPase subunit
LSIKLINIQNDTKYTTLFCGSESLIVDIALRTAFYINAECILPNFMIMDEPFTSFDENKRKVIPLILNELKKNFRYIIYISHLNLDIESEKINITKENDYNNIKYGIMNDYKFNNILNNTNSKSILNNNMTNETSITSILVNNTINNFSTDSILTKKVSVKSKKNIPIKINKLNYSEINLSKTQSDNILETASELNISFGKKIKKKINTNI